MVQVGRGQAVGPQLNLTQDILASGCQLCVVMVRW